MRRVALADATPIAKRPFDAPARARIRG